MVKNRRQPRAMSRRLRTALMGAGLVGVVVLVWFDRRLVSPVLTERTASHQHLAAQDLARYDGREFTVTRVIDGDTLHIDAPDGARSTTKVRLLGIDAPESETDENGAMYYASEATEFVRRAVTETPVTLYLDATGRTRGNYGRLLAYVELSNGRFLNDALLAEGLAYADLRFRHSRYQKYKQLAATARSLRRGLWAGVSRQQLPLWLQRMQPDLLADR
jgi:endonuclease YncB( thermonuclease family)